MTYLACVTTFAPILTNFSLSVVRVQPWADESHSCFSGFGLA
jgi:hypothetical protein